MEVTMQSGARHEVVGMALLVLAACGGPGPADKGELDFDVVELEVTKSAEDLTWQSQSLVGVDSHHPYANNENHAWEVEAPWCADQVRVHFASFALERGYDNLFLIDAQGQAHGRYTGTLDAFTSIALPGPRVTLRLVTDYSVVADGFVVDRVDYHQPPLRCPMMPTVACPADTVDVTPPPAPCTCPGPRVCAPAESLAVSHATGGGFSGLWTGRDLDALVARSTRRWPSGDAELTELGRVEPGRLAAYVRHLVEEGIFDLDPVNAPANMSESFRLRAGDREVSFVTPVGELPPLLRASLPAFDALFACGEGEPLTCAAELACVAGACTSEPEPCVCTEQYEPVCGADGTTYANACFAACAGVGVAAPGACNPWVAWETLLESPHPYTNDLDLTLSVTPPRAATRLRIHFTRLEVEEDWDFVIVRDAAGNEVARLTGLRDDTVVEVPSGAASVQLLTDYSIVRYGFRVTRVELLPRPDCPQLAPPAPGFCAGGEIVGRTDANGCALPPLCRRAAGAACNTGMHWPCDEGFGCLLEPAESLPNGVGTCAAIAHRPACGAIGSRSEGWYWQDAAQLIRWELCAGVVPVCTHGDGGEGWYESDGELIALGACTPEIAWQAGGVIESTHPYADDTDERWELAAPAGAARLRLLFELVELEPGYDHLYLLDANGAVVRDLSGSYAPFIVELEGGAASLRLLTDASITAAGFVATWQYGD
jgi:hypothetical protein